jgi:hypothetical protein
MASSTASRYEICPPEVWRAPSWKEASMLSTRRRSPRVQRRLRTQLAWISTIARWAAAGATAVQRIALRVLLLVARLCKEPRQITSTAQTSVARTRIITPSGNFRVRILAYRRTARKRPQCPLSSMPSIDTKCSQAIGPRAGVAPSSANAWAAVSESTGGIRCVGSRRCA